MLKVVVLALFLCVTPLSGAILYEIDTKKPLCCSFSNKHHNRILIEEGRVKKIMFPEEKLFIRMEDVSGQVFVQAKYQLQEPTVVSVITQEGLVQDIEITFSDCPSQVVVLKDGVSAKGQPLCEPVASSCCSSIDCSIACLLKGKMPSGYVSMPFRRSVFSPKLGITAKLVGKLQGNAETLCIYEIVNSNFWSRKIFEKEIACRGALWVFLEKKCLASKEKIMGIVAVQNE
jgi:hypothetical protein